MFGIPSPVLYGAAAVLAMGGVSYVAYNAGQDDIQNEFDDYKIERLEDELAYKEKLNVLITSLRERNQTLAETVRVEYVDRVNTITETEYRNRDVIKEVFVDSPYMPKGWVYTHDQLAKNEPIDPVKASNTELSDFTWMDSLGVISFNYSLAETARQKDKSWNEYYKGLRTTYGTASSSVPARPSDGTSDRTVATSSDGTD